MYIKRREREKEKGKREAESKETEREGMREGGRERDRRGVGGGRESGVLCKSALCLCVCVYVADVSQMFVSRGWLRYAFSKEDLYKSFIAQGNKTSRSV